MRRTVPGFKDLAVASKRLIEDEGCRHRGGPGHARARQPVDKVCAHEASTRDHDGPAHDHHPILEVFVHENEEEDPAKLAMVCMNRARDHARNAY